MALPSGVLTATVRFGPMIDDKGVPFSGRVTFTASRPKVWEATGTPIMPRALSVTLDEDGQGEIVLPATDQDGFTDGAGNAVKDWTYRVAIDLQGRASDSRSFQLPTGGQSGVVVDLDLMTPVPSSTGVVVALPSVMNVAGLTGAVTAEALAGALEPVLPTPDLAPDRSALGSRVVVDGDSITYGGTTTTGDNQDRANSWPAAMALASLGAIDLVWNAGVPGQRSDEMLARFDTAIAPRNPEVVIATIGTNDIQQNRTVESWLANLEAYRVKVESIGATLVVGTVYPTVAGGKATTVPVWNAALREWADAHKLRVIPWDVFTDPVTGGWPTGWSTDDLHPTALDSRQQLGAFAWDSIRDLFRGPVLRTADRFGSGLTANGRFENVTTYPAPATLTATPGTGGSLTAGVYMYRVTTRAYLGESPLSPAATATVAASGTVALTWPTVTANRGFRVYRRGPADVDFYLVAEVAANTLTWTDTGAATPGERATGVDTSAFPTDASWGSGSLTQVMGGGLLVDPSVKGRVLRMRPYTSGALSNMLLNPAATGTPGDTFELTGLVRGDGQNVATVYLRIRNGTTQTGLVKVYEGLPLSASKWGRFHDRVTIPAGSDNVIPLLVCNPGAGYVDYAEVRLQKVT